MGVSQEEGSIMHGYTKPKATNEQRLSGRSLAVELWTPGRPPLNANRERNQKNKQEHRNISPDKSPDCVMTCAGTFKPNF